MVFLIKVNNIIIFLVKTLMTLEATKGAIQIFNNEAIKYKPNHKQYLHLG